MINVLTLNFRAVLVIFLSMIISSCVGTVQSVDPTPTKVSSSKDATLSTFEGIYSAIAISNGKIEICFNPMPGNVDKFTYIISFDGQQIPTYVSANSLKPDYRGLVKYTVSGLDSNKKYTFQVQVRDIQTQIQSSNNVKVSATTFANVTANFYGISEVRNLSGASGLNGIEVLWPEAEVKGTDVFKNDVDPIEYKITVIDSTFLNPGNMNDTSFGEPVRKVISAAGNQRNLIINGLKSGTKYYVQVRAIHHGYTANAANAYYKVEENTNYLEIITYTEDLASLNFNNNSFFLTWPNGSGGLYALNGNWTIPTGNFDHYRLYYAEKGTINVNSFLNTQDVDSLCFGTETQDTKVSCVDAMSSASTASITGLKPNTAYDVVLAVCISVNCERTKRVISTTQSKTTTPNIANFQGITTIEVSNDISNLNTLQLNFLQPDFTTGNISGFLVDFYGNNPDSTTPTALNDSSVINSTSMTVDGFDYLNATSITLRGVDYSSTDQQCYMVYPFSYTSAGTKTISKSGLTPVCITPVLRGPTAAEFEGFSSSPDLCDKTLSQVSLFWSRPNKGIFDQYEIFYIKSSTTTFSFNDAINWETNPNYHRILVDESLNSYTLTNMATGANAVYQIGILSYYNSTSGPIRSEYNLKTIKCDFR
ncbi:MAG: hypothetical protein K2Q18_12350 [Bdellovibrionales bacterium]|nr:hypothetical protein [Bdellovibrionales bacterium]